MISHLKAFDKRKVVLLKKITFSLTSLFLLLCIISGCASDTSKNQATDPTTFLETTTSGDIEPIEVRVGALKGPTAMGMVSFMKEVDSGNVLSNDYHFSISAAIDEVTPKLIKGELDIASIPANLSSILYNTTKGELQVLAINTLGVLYIVESGDSVHTMQDLRGKTIYASGKGATPEFALNFLLTMSGIDPARDVTIEWKTEHSECVAALAARENAIAMLPQPFVTTAQAQNESIRIALDLTEEWNTKMALSDTIAPSTLITGVVVVRRDFAEKNPEAVSDFLTRYKASVDFVNSDIKAAAALIEEYGIIPSAVAEKALPYCNITFIEGAEMKNLLPGYLTTLFDQNPQAIGGALPEDDFYYER